MVLFALSAAMLLTIPASAAAHLIDVTEYGANPRDNEDDTEAIERAAADARELVRAQRPGGASLVGSGPALYFPAGIYYVSRQIDLSGIASLRGDSGKAIICWMDEAQQDGGPDAEAIFRIHAYTNKIENLKFIGGGTQLLFYNENTNQTMIDINGCEFQHATDFAIRAIPSGTADHLSTELTVRNCKFIFNYQCLETYADYTAV
ncbi:MAG: glycosyl hydrolase family 28-related protein, partial [Spirochaetota bacterium]